MGRSGPAGAPTALRLLRGDKKDRINFREPVVRDAMPEPPAGISAEVRAIWDYTLICYCEAVVAHRKSSSLLARSPVLVKGLHGGMVRNPALQIQRDAASTIRGFAQEFGLTPSARASIVMDGQSTAPHVNPFAALG